MLRTGNTSIQPECHFDSRSLVCTYFTQLYTPHSIANIFISKRQAYRQVQCHDYEYNSPVSLVHCEYAFSPWNVYVQNFAFFNSLPILNFLTKIVVEVWVGLHRYTYSRKINVPSINIPVFTAGQLKAVYVSLYCIALIPTHLSRQKLDNTSSSLICMNLLKLSKPISPLIFIIHISLFPWCWLSPVSYKDLKKDPFHQLPKSFTP